MKYYIKINGMYTAAVENEKSTLEFLQEHLEKEKMPRRETERILGDIAAWFKKTGEKIASHPVRSDSRGDLIVARIPKPDFRKARIEK